MTEGILGWRLAGDSAGASWDTRLAPRGILASLVVVRFTRFARMGLASFVGLTSFASMARSWFMIGVGIWGSGRRGRRISLR